MSLVSWPDRSRLRRVFVSCAVAPLLLSCASRAPAPGSAIAQLFASGTGYTLVNLHPGPTRHKLTAVNYQLAGLIPLCSRVDFTKWEGDRMWFRVEATGIEYSYDHFRKIGTSFEAHLDQYFGSKCDGSRVKRLSAADRKGIETGKVSPGMTKEGTTLAIGYPPPHATASLDANEWRYWKNRFSTLVVVFGRDGKVASIRN